MYKRRFNTWGIGKNVKRKNTSQTHYQHDKQTEAGAQVAARWIQSQYATGAALPSESVDRIQALERRSAKHITPVLPYRTPSPTPSLSSIYIPDSPDDLLTLERWMLLIRNYIPAAFDTGLWQPLPGGTLAMGDQPIAWYNRIRSCSLALIKGDSRQAFRTLGTCLDEYKDLVASQDPLLILFSVHSLLPIVKHNPDIAMSLLKYVRDIARVVHPKSHPIRLIMEHLYRIGLGGVTENASQLLKPYFKLLGQHLGPHIESVPECFALISRANATYEPGELATAGVSFEKVIDQLARYGEAFRFEVLGLRLARACNLLRRDLLDEAYDIVEQVLTGPDTPSYPNIVVSCYQLKFDIAFLREDDRGTLAAARAWVEQSMEKFGPGSYVTIDALGSLESYLRKAGDTQAANRTARRLAAATNELNRKRSAARKSAARRSAQER